MVYFLFVFLCVICFIIIIFSYFFVYVFCINLLLDGFTHEGNQINNTG